ncbi:MAG: metallophosphoesterase family protein [Bradymonadales bacterium]|nr:metallophosphoesterase family protein [Bradymonadales bacterium]
MIDRRQFLWRLLLSGAGLAGTGALPLYCSSDGRGDTTDDRGDGTDTTGDLPVDLGPDRSDLDQGGVIEPVPRPNPARCLIEPVQLPGAGEILAEELVTIEPDAMAVAWVTLTECRSVLAIEADGEQELQYTDDGTPRRFHLLEVAGLQPGRRYRYRTCQGDLAWEDPFGLSPRSLVTLARPPGARLFRFATLNDLHMGCDEVGLINGTGQAFCWPDPDNPHYLFSARSAVAELNQRGVDLVFVKGDLSSDQLLAEFELAREVLDDLSMPYYPMRGNHDRVGENPEDYFLTVFGDLLPDGHTFFAVERAGVRFVCLDSNRLEDGFPYLSSEQLAWLADELATSPDRPTFVLLHHAVSDQAGMVFSLLGRNRQEFIDTVAPHPQVAGILSGHSHRDRVTFDAQLGRIPCVETAATLHYPSGYAVYDVYQGGYTQISYRLSCPECLEWAEMTKELYDGRGVELLFAPADQRCFTYLF